MTFYEAALRVLESAGRPLHFLEITEKSIQQNLLSHVGKTPEQTMLSRLAAMARRRGDRKVIVTAKDTFALADWQLPEDPEALAQTGVPEANPEEDLPPLRPAERHPEARAENVRTLGRPGDKRRRHEEEDRNRRRRYPPLPEVVFEILSEAGEGLPAEALLERARSRELVSEEITAEQLLTALLEDNQRRIDAGRRPQYLFDKDTRKVSLERAGQPSEAPPLELQAAFAQALGIPLEGGRPVLVGRREERVESQADLQVLMAARSAMKDAKRAMARILRKKLADLDAGTFEKAVVRLMHALHFREVKVAKRSKEGPLLTARRKDGSLELRYAVRLLRGFGAIERQKVQELRKDLGHYAAQVGLLVSAGELRGDARGEAQSGQPLVFLWCGEALAEKFFEAKIGVEVQTYEMYEIDEAFFEQARIDAEEARLRREERLREKRERQAAEVAAEAAPSIEAGAAPSEAAFAEPAPAEAESGDQDEEGDEDLEAATEFAQGASSEPNAGAMGGERKRRRRRRRGRRGRGARPTDAAAPAADGSSPASDSMAAGASAPSAGSPAEAPPPSPPSEPPAGTEP